MEAALAQGATFDADATQRADLDGNLREDLVVEVTAADGFTIGKVMVLSFPDGWTVFVYERVPTGSTNLEELVPVSLGVRTFLPVRIWSARSGRATLNVWAASASGPMLAYTTGGAARDAYAVAAGTDGTLRVQQGRRPPVVLRWDAERSRLVASP